MGGPGMSSPPPMPGPGRGTTIALSRGMSTSRIGCRPPDETTRAGQHRYAPRSAVLSGIEDNTVQTVALGVGGALLVGWLMSRFMFSGDRGTIGRERYDIRGGARARTMVRCGSKPLRHPGQPLRRDGRDLGPDRVRQGRGYGRLRPARRTPRLGLQLMVGKRSGQVAYAVMSFAAGSAWARAITRCRGTR
jgi:hypothetical protein